MPQVSRRKLDKTIESEMFNQFWDSVSRLQTASDVSAFFTDLLTSTEEMMLAKRFMIAILLSRGKKPVEIGFILHVSFSTIGGVASWVKNAKPKTKQVMEEGCLSVRWLYGEVKRATKATVTAYDITGKKFTRSSSGLLAQIFQHEIDHLDGILFTDKTKELKEYQPKPKNK